LWDIRSVLVDKSCPSLIKTGPSSSSTFFSFFSTSLGCFMGLRMGLNPGINKLNMPEDLTEKKI
jgi:hypothetical protein